MKLPLFEEVREARRLAVESDQAARLHTQAGTTLSALSIAGRRITHGVELPSSLPGDDLIDEAIQAFPHLNSIAELAPAVELPAEQRLARRRQQLLALQELLAPIASQQQARAARVHALQHEQFHHLSDPAYAELRQGIEERNRYRADVQLAIIDQRNRLNGLAPACEGLDQLLPMIAAELEHLDDPVARSRAASRLTAATRIVGPALAVASISVPLPASIAAGTVTVDDDGLRAALDAWTRLAAALHSERDACQAELERLTRTYDDATAWILERTG